MNSFEPAFILADVGAVFNIWPMSFGLVGGKNSYKTFNSDESGCVLAGTYKSAILSSYMTTICHVSSGSSLELRKRSLVRTPKYTQLSWLWVNAFYNTEKNEMVTGRAYQQPQRRLMDLTCHHLETIWQEKTISETSQAVQRRPGQIRERNDMAEDSTRQANLETHAEAFAQRRDTSAAY